MTTPSFPFFPFMKLDIFVDNDKNLKQKYIESAEKHNKKLTDEPRFYDAGFDLFLPFNSQRSQKSGVTSFHSTLMPTKIDFKVKCCAKIVTSNDPMVFTYTPFYTYARSSLSKTPLRLANNQGIIDAGYRGNLIGMFDCLVDPERSDDRTEDYVAEPYTRMLQICAPSLMPIFVNIVDTIEELGPSTSRGEGGFGSTGK